MAKHTPRQLERTPWYVDKHGNVYDSGGSPIAHVFDIKYHKLIAAAPELLEAAEGLISVLNGFNGLLEVHANDDEIVGALDALLDKYGDIANKAIAKATEGGNDGKDTS